jgi:hypothetical protein
MSNVYLSWSFLGAVAWHFKNWVCFRMVHYVHVGHRAVGVGTKIVDLTGPTHSHLPTPVKQLYFWNHIQDFTADLWWLLLFFYWRLLPICGFLASSVLRFWDHTQGRTTVGRTPLDEWSVRHRDLYLTNTKQTSMPSAGFEPAIPAGEQLQTHALDCSATGIGRSRMTVVITDNHKDRVWVYDVLYWNRHISFSCRINTLPLYKEQMAGKLKEKILLFRDATLCQLVTRILD